jgi:hypothetical protein
MQCIGRQHRHEIAFIRESIGSAAAAAAASPVQARSTHPSGAESMSVQVIGVVEQRCRIHASGAMRTVIGREPLVSIAVGRVSRVGQLVSRISCTMLRVRRPGKPRAPSQVS